MKFTEMSHTQKDEWIKSINTMLSKSININIEKELDAKFAEVEFVGFIVDDIRGLIAEVQKESEGKQDG